MEAVCRECGEAMDVTEVTCGKCIADQVIPLMPGRTAPLKGYASLAEVLDMALEQAQSGKGKERHAEKDQAFSNQLICQLTRTEGHGFSRGQAIKKIDEAKRLDAKAAVRELLGAINYIAADIIVLLECDDS
jgi:hypothetical protein